MKQLLTVGKMNISVMTYFLPTYHAMETFDFVKCMETFSWKVSRGLEMYRYPRSTSSDELRISILGDQVSFLQLFWMSYSHL